MRAIFAIVLAAQLLACGGPAYGPDGLMPDPQPRRMEAGLSITVGTHVLTAVNSYLCDDHLPFFLPTASATINMTGNVDPVTGGHFWAIKFNPLFSSMSGYTDVNFDSNPVAMTMLREGGTLLFNPVTASLDLHAAPPVPTDYNHDETTVPGDVQVFPADGRYPAGHVAVGISPRGVSDPARGECSTRQVVTFAIQ